MEHPDYQAIKIAFDKFVNAWESGAVDLLDDIVAKDTGAVFSIFGECHGREALKQHLKQRKPFTYVRIESGNFIALIEGTRSYQSGCVVGFFGLEQEDTYSSYEWGGNFCNIWEKKDDRWMLIDIRFDLQDDLGDLSLVDNWIPINDTIGWYSGVALPAISGELDTPWVRCKNRENIGTDREQIEELYYRYALGIDCNTFSLLEDVFSEDLVLNMAPFGTMSKRTFIATLKVHRQAFTRRWHHVGYFEHIDIHGDTADAVLYRREPYRKWPLEMTKDLEKANIIAARYDVKCVKENGKWRISRFDYFHGPFILGYYE